MNESYHDVCDKLLRVIDELADLVPTTEVGDDYEVNLDWEIEQVDRLRQKATQLINQLRDKNPEIE